MLDYATPVSIGGLRFGLISDSSDIDYFGFNGYAGEGYWIQVESIDTVPVVILRDSYGEIIAEGELKTPIGIIELKWDSPRDGPYYLEITAPQSGHYALIITNIDTVDDHGHDFSSATDVVIDEAAWGRINWLRDVDYFKFEAERGFEYEVVATIEDMPTELRTFNSDGTLIATSVQEGPAKLTFDATETGAHYLEVRSSTDTAILGYSFTVRRLERFDHGGDIGSASELTRSQPVRGDVQPGGDVDFFAFEGEADQIAIVNLNYNIIGGMVLRLHDAAGRTLAEDSEWGPAREGQPFDFSEEEWIARRLPATGTYYVSVFSTLSNQLGYYQLSLGLESALEYHGHAPVADPLGEAAQLPISFDAPNDYRQSAVPVGVGEATTFRIQDPSDVNTFSFDAMGGQIYNISARSSHSNIGLLVLDPNGGVVAEANGYGVYSAGTSIKAALSGTYFVAVTVEITAVVSSGEVSLVVELDDHGGELYLATPLSLGEATTANTNESYELDFFKFTAQKGTTYSIDIDKLDRYAHLVLYTPDELILADLTGHDVRLPFRWRATSDGEHYLTILNVADYTLTVNASEPDSRDDHGNDIQSATHLTFGQNVEGVIDINGVIDLFNFTAEQDQAYVINLVSDLDKDRAAFESDNFAATVELVTAEGISLLRSPTGHHNWGYEARMLWEPTTSGEYYLKVYGNWHGYEIVGDYRLNVEVSKYQDQHAGSVYDATPLEIGETKHGFIGCHDDVDTFKFRAKPKTSYRVILHKEYAPDIGIGVHDGRGLYLGPQQYYKPNYGGPSIDPPWIPAWQAPICVDFQPNPEPEFVQESLVFAHQGGDLFVNVHAGRRGHNRYSITIQEDDYRDDHGDRRATATDIRFGEIIKGELDIQGESDVFKFQAQEGQAFEFELSLDSLTSACLLLIERGDLASEEWCTRSRPATETRRKYTTAWVAPRSADVFLVVQSHGLGNYSLVVNPIEVHDDHGNVHKQATAIEFSIPVQGRIDAAEDVDVFAIDAEDGDVIRLTLNHDSLDQIDVDLYDTVNGEHLWGTVDDVDYDLRQRDNAQTVQRIWRTVRAGTHYLDVKAVSVGQYSVNLTRAEYQDDFGNNPVDAQILSMDVEIEGEIDVTGDADFFAFEAEIGKVYRLNLTPLTIERRRVEILDSERTKLHHFGDEFRWQAPSTGVFNLAVFVPRYWPNTGTYKLVVNRLQDDDHGYNIETASRLTLDQKTPGELTWPDDDDYFVFEANAGEQYLIDLVRQDGRQGAISILNAQGKEIFREFHINDIIWTAPNSGLYYIMVEHVCCHQHYSIVVTLSDYKDDHGDDFDNATKISVGESVHGEIAWRDADYFRFNVEKGSSYHLELEKGTIHVSRMRVVDAEDARIEAQYSEIDDKTIRISFEASYDGTLYAVVDPYRTRGTYTIRFGSSD